MTTKALTWKDLTANWRALAGQLPDQADALAQRDRLTFSAHYHRGWQCDCDACARHLNRTTTVAAFRRLVES